MSSLLRFLRGNHAAAQDAVRALEAYDVTLATREAFANYLATADESRAVAVQSSLFRGANWPFAARWACINVGGAANWYCQLELGSAMSGVWFSSIGLCGLAPSPQRIHLRDVQNRVSRPS